MEIDHEIISTVILFFPLIQEGLLSVINEICAHSTVYNKRLVLVCLGKGVIRLLDCLDMTAAVDWGVKPLTKPAL